METQNILGSFSTEGLTFDPEKHVYRVKGIPIPSVTQLMKPLSTSVYNGIDESILQAAADKGTAVHSAIEFFLKYGIAEYPEQHKGYFDAFLCWYRDNNPEIILTESMTYHKQLLYAGTVDLVAKVNGLNTLIDYKTTTVIHDMLTTVQLEAYQRALATNEVKVEQKAILQLRQDGTYSFKVYQANDLEAWKTFSALITIQGHMIRYGGGYYHANHH